MEQLERKHYYGLAAIGVSVAAVLFGLVSWFINQKMDMPVQVAFAVALLGLALFAWLEVDLLTRALGTRQARFGAETLVMVVAFLGVVGLLNYIFTQDRLKKRWDLTENQQHTLAPETLKVLSELTAPVKVIGFYTANASFSQQSAEDLLSDYKANSGG
nr:Gldg family protein [Chloroflexota bacterium]